MTSPAEDLEDDDEEISQIRAVRHEISERFGHDPYKLVAYYMERQKEHADRLVRATEAEDLETTSPAERR